MRALVTGASGFVGMHTVRALRDAGHDVSCLVRKTSNVELIEPLGVELLYGDVIDRESVRAAIDGHHAVLHVAGTVKAFEPRRMFEVNQRGMANVAQACAKSDAPPTLTVVSSLAAAGPAANGRAKMETDPPRPVSIYGRSKLAGEKVARRYAADVPTTIIRPAIVFGEADRGCLEIFQQIVKTRLHISPGFRAKPYSMIHGTDLSRLLLLAAEKGERLSDPMATGPHHDVGVYYAASEQTPTFGQFGRMIAQSLGIERLFCLRTGPIAVKIAGAWNEAAGRRRGEMPAFNRDKARESLAGPWYCSPEKAKRELGFEIEATLEQRLQQTADWYKEHGWV